jgi:glycosyltransferase involved in cell wall biosynthesis
LKGHHRLIEAMPALHNLAPDAHLAVIGRGPFEHELRRLAARLQVEHAVTFTSFDATQREALGALVRSCDVVALMSDYEAHPVAVMEAIALGRKVVVADTSGLSELATEGLAVAVPVDASPRALAEVLAEVARRPDPVAPNLPTWDDCANELLGLYGEILGASTESGTR